MIVEIRLTAGQPQIKAAHGALYSGISFHRSLHRHAARSDLCIQVLNCNVVHSNLPYSDIRLQHLRCQLLRIDLSRARLQQNMVGIQTAHIHFPRSQFHADVTIMKTLWYIERDFIALYVIPLLRS